MNKKSLTEHKKGLTLVEVTTAFVLGALLLVVVISMWYFAYKNWTIERVRTSLRVDLEVAMERIKNEARLSSATYLSGYPLDGATYEAISFPLPDLDSNGFALLDADGNIDWETSVIYHVYNNPSTGKTELRRTEFSDNGVYLTNEDYRETQLVNVVANGDGSEGPNSANANTKVVFENLVDFIIEPQARIFDGYNSTLQRSDNVEFGSIKLEPGEHIFKFEVVGKNENSAGYKMGVDTISIAPSGCQREGEALAISDDSGDSAAKVYHQDWSGKNYLKYSSTGVGDHISFALNYDSWLESNFYAFARDNIVISGDDLLLKLATPKEGRDTSWQAALQTGNDLAVEDASFSAPVTIRNVLKQESITIPSDQKLVRVNFYNQTSSDIIISSAYLAKRSSDDDAADETSVQLYFSSAPTDIGEEETETPEIGGTPGVTPVSVAVPSGQYVYSNWVEQTWASDSDYLVTFYTNSDPIVLSSWADADSANSYCWYGDHASNEVWDDGGAGEIFQTNNIYATEIVEMWKNTGSTLSVVYDTQVDSVAYNTVDWDQYLPSGTSATISIRTSPNDDMSGATSWQAVSKGGSIPSALDNKRYAQFRVRFDTDAPYNEFPWLDNIEITWDGYPKMCDISGYFTQDSDYGMIKLTIDDKELTKGLDFTMRLYDSVQGDMYEAGLSTEIEPRNTGK